jgi:phosphatidate cytidylyltransferase
MAVQAVFLSGNELQKRVTTAALLILPLMILLLGAAFFRWLQIGFVLLVGVICNIAAWEFTRFCRLQYASVRCGIPFFFFTAVPTIAVTLFYLKGMILPNSGSQYDDFFIALCIVATAIFVFVASIAYWLYEINWREKDSTPLADEVLIWSFLFVLGAPSLVFVATNWESALWLILVIAINDSCAYFAGKAWGERRLAPRSSPGKTVVGSVAGLTVGSLVSCLLPYFISINLFFNEEQSFLTRMVFSVGLGCICIVMAQLADIAKSHAKRLHSVKDSGSILPGHGGVLDRIDGLLGGSVAILGCYLLKSLVLLAS